MKRRVIQRRRIYSKRMCRYVNTDGTICTYTGLLDSIGDDPAVTYTDGQKEWFKDGKRHRLNAPAIIYPDGRQCWFVDDKLHREDGPAIVLPGHTGEYFINGENVSPF